MKKEMDMLSGGLSGKLIAFSVPLALSAMLQQLFNSADQAIVGKFANSLALAAVSANVANVAIFVNFIVGSAIGPNVIIARLIGENRREEINRNVNSIIAFSIILGLILFAISELMSGFLIDAINTPTAIKPQALVYLRIYLIGVPFMVTYNYGAGIIRSKGETTFPLICMIVSGVVNVILNIVFVVGFKIPVAGVAIATTISNAIASFMMIIKLMKETDEFKLHLGKLRLHKEDAKELIKIGFPSGVQSMVFSISNEFVQGGINSFGEQAIAGSAIALNFEYFSYDFVSAFGQAAVTFYSQNYGAGNHDRCTKIYRLCMIYGFAFCEALALIFIFGANFFVYLYTNDVTVAEFAIARMWAVLLLEGVCSTYEITAAVLRSRGYYMTPSVITIIGTVVFRIVYMVTVFRLIPRYTALLYVYIASWILTFVMMYIAYRRCLKAAPESGSQVNS